MSTKLVEEENTVYEIDEDCMKEKKKEKEKTVEIEDDFLQDFSKELSSKEFKEFESEPVSDCFASDCNGQCKQKKGTMHENLWVLLLIFCLCWKK